MSVLNPLYWDQRLLELEMKYFNMSIARKWSKDVFPHVFGVSFLYVVLIFWGVNVMKRREKFGLQRALVLWNAGLCWYSFFTLYRFAPQFWEEYRTGKWVNMICDISYTEGGGTAVWSFLFPVSKIFEFGDTLFVVLKKKQLIFLHWYHHITVLWFCWYCLAYPIGPGRLFACINLFVHTIMYGYYAVSASHLYRIPRWVNMLVTTLQIAQMFAGAGINIFAYQRMLSGQYCAMSVRHLTYSLLMYFSYIVLFGNYFYQTYLVKKKVQ